MNDKPNESDWKAFKGIVPDLRERYLQQRNTELIEILQDSSLTPTEQFWTAEERLREIAKILGDCFDGFSRSKMKLSLLQMRRHKMLTDEDLTKFSDELRELLKTVSQD